MLTERPAHTYFHREIQTFFHWEFKLLWRKYTLPGNWGSLQQISQRLVFHMVWCAIVKNILYSAFLGHWFLCVVSSNFALTFGFDIPFWQWFFFTYNIPQIRFLVWFKPDLQPPTIWGVCSDSRLLTKNPQLCAVISLNIFACSFTGLWHSHMVWVTVCVCVCLCSFFLHSLIVSQLSPDVCCLLNWMSPAQHKQTQLCLCLCRWALSYQTHTGEY